MWTNENGCGLLGPRTDDMTGCERKVFSRLRRCVRGSLSIAGRTWEDCQPNAGNESVLESRALCMMEDGRCGRTADEDGSDVRTTSYRHAVLRRDGLPCTIVLSTLRTMALRV